MAIINTSGMAGSISRTAPQRFLGTPARVLFSLTLLAGMLAVLLNAVYAQDPTPTVTPGAATPVATPSVDMLRVELKLQEQNESGVDGKVTLFVFGDRTIVDFAAKDVGGDHPAMIVRGVCGDTADNPIADLELVDKFGKSRTVVDTSLSDLLQDDYSIVIRMSEKEMNTIIACAHIEGTPSLAPTATPVASPVATPSATAVASPTADAVGGTTKNVDGTGGASNADAQVLNVKLVDWSKTGITGTAVLAADGENTQVSVNISGPGVIGGHELHIHNGTCATPGTATYTLNPIDANGASTTTVNLSIDQLTRGNYFINVHPDEDSWDAWMVCGNINGQTTTVIDAKTGSTSSSISDGSVGGNTTLVTTDAQAGEFPTKVGVGDGLRWPSENRNTAVAALGVMGATLLIIGVIMRIGQHDGHRVSRFHRLGL